MQVAVAGVEDVGHAQAMLVREVPMPLQHTRQFAARDGAVHAVVVRRDAAHGRERVLAAGPEALAFGLVFRETDIGGAGRAQQCVDALHVFLRRRLSAPSTSHSRIASASTG